MPRPPFLQKWFQDRCLHDETEGAVTLYECAGTGCEACRDWILDQEREWRLDDEQKTKKD